METYACLFVLIVSFLCHNVAEPQLKLLNIIFRHGDRTPTKYSLYSNDPYSLSDYYPLGYGDLTNSGKLRAYKLGEFLHGRYKNFLGDVYLPQQLYARSTDYDRTKMSLQLVLAALFPPSDIQKWHDTLNWQPIPISYVPKPLDDLLATIHLPAFETERNRVLKQKDIQDQLDNLRQFMSELSNHTGNEIKDSLDMKKIHDTLTSESFMNFTLPDWTKEVISNGKLLEGLLLEYRVISYDKNITTALAGKFMSEITANILEKTHKNDTAKKLFLYSGHEINIIGVLRSLNIYKLHEPKYSNAVMIELLEQNNQYYVKILYYCGIDYQVQELQIPGCDTLCPLEKYLTTVNETIYLNIPKINIPKTSV